MNAASDGANSARVSLEGLRAIAHTLGGPLVIEHAPQETKNAVDAWDIGEPNAALMRRVKNELDANDMLSPGRFTMRA